MVKFLHKSAAYLGACDSTTLRVSDLEIQPALAPANRQTFPIHNFRTTSWHAKKSVLCLPPHTVKLLTSPTDLFLIGSF